MESVLESHGPCESLELSSDYIGDWKRTVVPEKETQIAPVCRTQVPADARRHARAPTRVPVHFSNRFGACSNPQHDRTAGRGVTTLHSEGPEEEDEEEEDEGFDDVYEAVAKPAPKKKPRAAASKQKAPSEPEDAPPKSRRKRARDDAAGDDEAQR